MNAETARRERNAANAELRAALIDRLDDEGAPDLAKPLRNCGQPVPLVCTCCGRRKVAETRCKARYCPACAPLVSAERLRRWGHAIRSLTWPLFITLTIPNSEDPERLRELRKHWGKFRRRKLLRDRVRGGVATFEVTNKGNGWHPHLHAICDCRWLSLHTPEPRSTDPAPVVAEKCSLAQQELSALWADQIAERSAVVWIQRAYGDGAAREILKYACKGSDLVNCAAPVAPLLRVLKSTRTLSGWGTLYPLPSPDADQAPTVECPGCGAESPWIPEAVANLITRPAVPINGTRTLQPRKHQDR